MQVVPLKAVPSQYVTTQLGNQYCQINIYQKFYGVFVDLYVSNVLILAGVLAQNLNRIVRSAYFGFSGDFVFVDSQGSNDPSYDGLGSRYQLIYLMPSEVIMALGAA